MTEPADAGGLLAEAVETLRAIRHGEVDALVMADGSPGEQVFTLSGADRPYRMFVENMRDGAATVSDAGIVLYANRRLAELLSRPLSRIIGAPLSSLVMESHRAALAAQDHGDATGGTVQIELIGPDSQPIPVRVGGWVLDVDDERLLCLTFADLTQVKHDQEELTRARDTAVQASRLRSAFVANAVLIPVFLTAVGLVLLVGDAYGRAATLAVGLAGAFLVAAMVRLTLTFRRHAGMLTVSREEALTDALTGLRNRRCLVRDLQLALESATDERPVALALFDLNGFKQYNDSFGHQSGDALLARLGGRLARTLAGDGRGYRMGGDEFCALIDMPAPEHEALVEAAGLALSEGGEGFSINPAHGMVALPLEAQSASEALRISDQRMYAQKHTLRPPASHQSRDVLLRALVECDSELGDHLESVGPLAEKVARHLRLPWDEIEQIRHAADLHDVGKVAIPDHILNKPSDLNEEEWVFVRRHTLVGERIMSAAPALAEAGRLVRSTHERWDGAGYPHGLSGDSIPLGARIVAVCDAFDAMVSERPYSRPTTRGEALTELRRCAGTQFDPAIVTAFEAVAAQPAMRDAERTGRDSNPRRTPRPLLA